MKNKYEDVICMWKNSLEKPPGKFATCDTVYAEGTRLVTDEDIVKLLKLLEYIHED